MSDGCAAAPPEVETTYAGLEGLAGSWDCDCASRTDGGRVEGRGL